MSGGGFGGPSAREIAEMLRPHAEALGFMVFPAARRIGGFLCVDSLDGEPGDNLKIQLRGHKAGTWVNYGTADSDPRGKGDLLKLLQLTVGGGDLRRGIDEAKRFLKLDTMDPAALERQRRRAADARARAERDKAKGDERRRIDAERMWLAAAPLTPGDPAASYLRGRGIDLAELGRAPGALRCRLLRHAEHRRDVPAMVTAMVGLDGRHMATHVTYLDRRPDGSWGKVAEWTDPDTGKRHQVAKKIFGVFDCGAHMPLWKGDARCKLAGIAPGTAVEVGEGIEDALSFALANRGARIVAAGSLWNIGQLRLPAQAGDLHILAQRDTKPQPIAALEAAIQAQQRQAREQGSPRRVACRWPAEGFKDWNDWLRGERQG